MEIRLPANTAERLSIGVDIALLSVPTSITPSTALSSTALTELSPGPSIGWEDADWVSTDAGWVVASHLIDHPSAGSYGLWLRLSTDQGESLVLFAARVTVT